MSVFFYSMQTCCGVLECGTFNLTLTKEEFLKRLKTHIQNEYHSDYSPCPKNFIAVTNDQHQKPIEKVLESLGFDKTRIYGKEKNNLYFWTHFGLFPEIKDEIEATETELDLEDED